MSLPLPPLSYLNTARRGEGLPEPSISAGGNSRSSSPKSVRQMSRLLNLERADRKINNAGRAARIIYGKTNYSASITSRVSSSIINLERSEIIVSSHDPGRKRLERGPN